MAATKTIVDQMGNAVTLAFPPQRIISLVPSQSELLFDLGLEEQVIGITKFCERPATWRKEKVIVGGTKRIRHDVIEVLKPDLIIGNKEENSKEDIEELQRKYAVWMSDIVTLEDALKMIGHVAELTNKIDQGQVVISKINEAFQSIKQRRGSVLYLIWMNPWMGAGSNTFIDSILAEMGFANVLRELQRYPELLAEQIRELNPEYVLLSSEPFPFQEKHMVALREILPKAKILLVDGQYFSWYGSRLVGAPDYFQSLFAN
ncbi:MAG: helical backbone metal receptor [Cyclobacteriaceae bacterium]